MNSAGKAEAQLAIQFITDLQQQCDTETYTKLMNLLAEYYKQGNGAGEVSEFAGDRRFCFLIRIAGRSVKGNFGPFERLSRIC